MAEQGKRTSRQSRHSSFLYNASMQKELERKSNMLFSVVIRSYKHDSYPTIVSLWSVKVFLSFFLSLFQASQEKTIHFHNY